MKNSAENFVPDGTLKFNLEKYIPYLIHQSHLRILEGFEEGLASYAMSLAEWRVVAALSHHGSMRFGDLAQATGLEPPTLVRVLTGMEGKGWVTRRSSKQDRRATDVKATAAGLAMARSIVPLAEQAEARALEGFTQDEAEFLRRLLLRLKANVSR